MLSETIKYLIGQTVFTKDIREKFLQYHPDEDLKKWFDPLVLSYAQSGEIHLGQTLPGLTVKFPHKLFADWWGSRHRDKFEHTLFNCLERRPNITYSCPGAIKLRTAPPKADAIIPAILEDEEEAPEQTFENFIFNRKNQFPYAAAKNFSQEENGPKGQGLFILFGPSGCGKTHLLQAIHNEVRKNVPKKVIILKQLNELETFCAKAFKNSQSILTYLRKFKYILIDDLDMAESRAELQEQLVMLLEAAGETRVNVAITLKQKPGSLSFMSEKLRSLLEAGLAIELKKPDLDVRRQYIDYSANKLNLQLKKDDALALARMYSGFRQIDGALLKVSSFLVLSPQAAEAKLADILQTNLPDEQKRLSPDHIIGSVAEYFKLTPSDITGKKRRQNIVFARHLSMYLCRELLGAQLGHIGACFSDRDHSSVLYSVNKISNMLKSDKDTNNLVTEVKNIIMK